MEQAGNQDYQTDHMGKIFTEGFSFSGFERDKLYLSARGERFIDISGVSGLDSVTDGRGAVHADFDNDGDYDIFLTALQGQVQHLFRNNVGQDRGFVRVTLEGTESGTDAYGAEVGLRTSQGVLTKIKAGGRGFVSQGDGRLLFGLGDDREAEWLEVRWPSGARQRFEAIPAFATVKVVEGNPELEYLNEPRFSLPDPPGADAPLLRALQHRPGEVFPALKMVDLDGRSTDFQAYRRPGRVYLVNLWATWCGPCRAEMPELQRVYPELEKAGIDLVGISLDMGRERDRVAGFLSRMGVTYPVFTTDETAFAQIYAGDQVFVPLSFVIDRQGRIADVFAGWSLETAARIRRLADGAR